MEDLPDIVVDNGRNPSCDSEGEAHVSEQCLESSSLTNNGMKNESTTIEKVLGGKNKQLCSICETPARTTWLVCDVCCDLLQGCRIPDSFGYRNSITVDEPGAIPSQPMYSVTDSCSPIH